MAATAAAAGPVVAAGDNQSELLLLLEGFVVIPTTLESEEKFSNENWRVYFQPEEVIAYITRNHTSLIIHVKMEMVDADFKNRNSIIYLTTSEFMKKYTRANESGHDETTGLTVAPSPALTSLTGLTLTSLTDPTITAPTVPTLTTTIASSALNAANVASPAATGEANVASPAAANSSNQNKLLFQDFQKRINNLIELAKDVNLQFGIANYNTLFEDGWRHATTKEWKTPQFQAALILAHNSGNRNGWAILNGPLECNNSLYVDEGEVKINGHYVVEVGFNVSQTLNGVYPAMNFGTQKAWTEMPPKVDGTWSVVEKDTITDNPPCLFVKEPIQNNSLEVNQFSEAAAASLRTAAAAAVPTNVKPNKEIAVGYYGKSYEDDGWIAMPGGFLTNNIHIILQNYWIDGKNDGGFFLLENEFNNNNILCVTEGTIRLNGQYIIRDTSKSKMNKYVATSWIKDKYPTIDNNKWEILRMPQKQLAKKPCLFMKKTLLLS